MLKTALTQTYNRCEHCGRRLKLQPGAFINSTGARFLACRSCGHVNQSFIERVADQMREAGIPVPGELSAVTHLNNCSECGVEIQVSKDFTKVFCRRCGREWGRYQVEEINEEPISPELAGLIPIPPASDKDATSLENLLDANDVEYGTIYFAAKMVSSNDVLDTPDEQPNLGIKFFTSAFKEGWYEGELKRAKTDKDREKVKTKLDEATSVRGLTRQDWLAIHDGYIGYYVEQGNEIVVQREVEFSDTLFDPEASNYELGFGVGFQSKKKEVECLSLLAEFKTIHWANATPYKEKLYGKAAQAEEEQKQATSLTVDLVAQLERLSDMHQQGILSDEEFGAAKARLLS